MKSLELAETRPFRNPQLRRYVACQPGTIAEAACLGVPTLLTGFVPGQEEENVAWAERNGGAVFEPRPRRVAALVERWLLSGGDVLEAMSVRMREMGRPEASRVIADAVLSLLP